MMDVRNVVLFVSTLVGAVLFYYLNKSIWGDVHQKFQRYIYLATITITVLIMQFVASSGVVRISVFGVVNFLLLLYMFEGSPIVKLFVAALLVTIVQVGDIFTWGVVLLLFPEFISGETTINPNIIFALGTTISYFYIGIVVLIFHIFPLRYYGSLTKGQGLLISVMPLFSYAIIALLLQYLQAQQRDEFYLFLLPSLFFIALLLFIVLFFRNMQRSQENAKVSAVLNTQLEHFGAQYEELEESMQLFRERSHDWKNHLLVIQSLSNSDDTTKLREYISKVTGADDVMLKMYTGHPAIDVILTALKRKAERTRIDVDISARLAKEIDISQADICVLVSNAVDNAYEACERTTKGDRRIDIKIVTDEVYFVFIISNTMQEPPKQSRGKFLTSKADNVMHGIGLQSIKRIADKHFGHVTIATDNDVFTLNCALKNKKVTD